MVAGKTQTTLWALAVWFCTVGAGDAFAVEEWIGETRPIEDIWNFSSTKPVDGNTRASIPSGEFVFRNTSLEVERSFNGALDFQSGVSVTASGKGDGGWFEGLVVFEEVGVSGAWLRAEGTGAQASGLTTHDEFWIANNGQVEALGAKGGSGIKAQNLRFYSGTLTLLPDPGGTAGSASIQLTGSDSFGPPDAQIKADATVYVPVQKKADGTGWGVGRMLLSFEGSADKRSDVLIEKGATLSLQTSNVLDMVVGKKNDAGAFIEIATGNDGTIQDNAGWVGQRSNGVLGYDVSLSADKRTASISVTREALLSDKLQGPGRNILLAVERAPAASREQSDFYDYFANNFDPDATRTAIRSLTPQAGALLPRVSMVITDAGFNTVRRETLLRARPPEPQQFASRESVSYISDLVQPRENLSVWFAPFGGFDHLRESGSAYTNSEFNYGGGSVGLSSRLGSVTLSVAGLAAFGRLDLGHDGQSRTKSFGVVGSAVTDPLNTDGWFAPWLSASAGYLYTNADQDRREVGGANASAQVDSHTFRLAGEIGQDFEVATSWRLTPSLGLDYTRISQGSYSETSGAAPMSVDSTHLQSLRPRIGVEVAHEIVPGFELRAEGNYLYEALDTAVDLEYGIAGLRNIGMTGQDRGRHFGQIGLGATYHAGNSFTLNGGYTLTVGDRYDGHNLYLRVKYEF